MVMVKNLIRILSIFFIFVILFVGKSSAEEGVQVSDDPQSKGAGAGDESKQDTAKEQEAVSEDTDHQAPAQEDTGCDSSKLDNSEPPVPSKLDEKTQILKTEDGDQHPPEIMEPKPESEKSESNNQPSGESEEKREETKSEDVEPPLIAVDSKKLNSKEDENTHVSSKFFYRLITTDFISRFHQYFKR
ncbi:hypothetical protein J6590_031676 [Homalodisca vitripennis]|nr:hypothetical protein J6590_031676 [Homalodisca vitripennis]